MSYTKRQFVLGAFEELGMANYVFDLQPEQIQGAARRLDAMLAEWNGRGVSLGYTLATLPDNVDVSQDSGVPDWANEAIILNLALRIAPGYGKMVPLETKQSAKSALETVMRNVTTTREQQFPSHLPVGAGYKSRDAQFYPPPTDPTLDKPEVSLEFEG